MDKELEELKIKAAGWHFASEYTPDEFAPGEGWSDEVLVLCDDALYRICRHCPKANVWLNTTDHNRVGNVIAWMLPSHDIEKILLVGREKRFHDGHKLS